MPRKAKTPKTKKPKGKTVITQKVIVNVSKRGTSKPRGPPQPSQAERLFQLMAQQQQSRPLVDASLVRLLQPAQPIQPSLSQLQQLLRPSPPIIVQGIQGPQGPQGPAGPPGMTYRPPTSEAGTQFARPPTSEAGTQFTPSTAEKASQRTVETTSVAIGEDYIAIPTAKPLVEPPRAQVDTTPQPLPTSEPSSEKEEEENKYEEKPKEELKPAPLVKKRPVLIKKPKEEKPKEEAKEEPPGMVLSPLQQKALEADELDKAGTLDKMTGDQLRTLIRSLGVGRSHGDTKKKDVLLPIIRERIKEIQTGKAMGAPKSKSK